MGSTLLRGGRVLEEDGTTRQQRDVLVEDGVISAVGTGLSAEVVLDCTGRPRAGRRRAAGRSRRRPDEDVSVLGDPLHVLRGGTLIDSSPRAENVLDG